MLAKYGQKLNRAEKKELLTGQREIRVGESQPFFCNNGISTTKYTLYNFFFLNLYEQFCKIANIYFLLLAFLQTIDLVSITGGIPTILPPLAFIVLLTMIKDVYEDYKRYQSDKEENNKEASKVTADHPEGKDVCWQTIRAGDIIKVHKNEFFPCDLLVLASSDKRRGQCFIETKGLDGETNLKTKSVPQQITDHLGEKGIDGVLGQPGSIGVVSSEGPNPYLYTFKGFMTISDTKFPLDNSSLVLRGCSLRNTDYIYGVAIYTGHQTKVMMNSIKARPKMSTLERNTGYAVVVTFLILFGICFLCGLVYSLWANSHSLQINMYISSKEQNFFHNFFMRMGNWLLIFSNFVPISLMLTLETVKFFQGGLMGIDQGLVSSAGTECKVQSSNLNEELGQVDYVFSDKTGTLTCNEMRFKYLIVGKEVYGRRRGYNGSIPFVKNVDFEDPKVWESAKTNFASPTCQRLKTAILTLGLCHTVVLEQNGDYNASSPDELAFVNFAKLVGCEYKGMDEDNFLILEEFGQIYKYKLLQVFEFNSDRKRMSAIIQDQNGKITLFCKGADSIMIPRYHSEKKHQFDSLMQTVEEFAAVGLRTLLLGAKDLSQEQYNQFKNEYDAAKNNLKDREAEMAIVEDKWEKDFELVGATAIEDKLQDKVPESIELIRKAGIKVWVLTGDKVDTAKNIGFSCRLLVQEGMTLLEYPKKKTDDLLTETDKLFQKQLKARDAKHQTGFLVTGELLQDVLAEETSPLAQRFTDVALAADVVLCCRVSPKQKQEIVALVKRNVD